MSVLEMIALPHRGRNYNTLALPQFRRLVAYLPPRKPAFDPRLFRVEFVVGKVAGDRVFSEYFGFQGTAVAQWLRCCATNRKVAGSIPAGVIGIFH